MIANPLPRLWCLTRRFLAAARARVAQWTRPIPLAVAAGVVADATRSRSDLLLENALLRHQLVVLGRTVTRPRLTCVGYHGHPLPSQLRPCPIRRPFDTHGGDHQEAGTR